MSKLEGTDRDAELRRLIREHARGQEGYDARLFDLWDEWNDDYFDGRMVNVGQDMANHGVPGGSRVKVDESTKVCSSWAEKDYRWRGE
jgi:hypothetical protein